MNKITIRKDIMPLLKLIDKSLYLTNLSPDDKSKCKTELRGSRFFQKYQGFQIPEIYVRKALEKNSPIPFNAELDERIPEYFEFKKSWNPEYKFSKHVRNKKWIWQAKLIKSILPYKSYALFLEPGCGKTIISLEIIKQIMHNKGKYSKFIIISPSEVINTVFRQTLRKWYRNKIRYQIISSDDTDEKIAQIRRNVNVYLITPESFRKKDYHSELFKRHEFEGIFVDESGKYMREGNQLTNILLKHKDDFNHRFVMSGLPAPNSPLEYFWQMNFVDDRLTGFSFDAWRNYYFHPADKRFYTWEITDDKLQEMMIDIQPLATWIKAEDVLDLPPEKEVVRVVDLNDKQMDFYENLRKETRVKFKDLKFINKTTLEKIMKLREITSGFIYHRGRPKNIGSDKLRVLRDLIEEKFRKKQMIIFCHFTQEVKLVSRLLDKMKISYELAFSESKDKTASLLKFMSKKTQVLVANADSAGHGLNLQNCHITIYFSLSYSSDLLVQSKARTRRPGQKKTCYYIYLIARNTIDKIMYDCLKTKISKIDFARNVLRKKQKEKYHAQK